MCTCYHVHQRKAIPCAPRTDSCTNAICVAGNMRWFRLRVEALSLERLERKDKGPLRKVLVTSGTGFLGSTSSEGKKGLHCRWIKSVWRWAATLVRRLFQGEARAGFHRPRSRRDPLRHSGVYKRTLPRQWCASVKRSLPESEGFCTIRPFSLICTITPKAGMLI